MSSESFDDDFGGFEAAPSTPNPPQQSTNSLAESKPKSDLPEWLLQQSLNLNSQLSDSNMVNMSNNSNLVNQLQEELCKTKEQLLDQQTRYLQTQTIHRKEIDDTTNSFNIAVREFQSLLKQSLNEQRELLTKEFKVLLERQALEYDARLAQKMKEMQKLHEVEANTKLEDRFAEFQERMIVNYESDLQDLDVKVRKIVSATIKEENLVEKTKLKQNFEQIGSELKSETERYVQVFFKNQSEVFKEQIKSGIQQEHLIHKDLINTKLEKLFKSSEEKRRASNLLFNRHMTGLSFFIDNAHKHLGIMHQAQSDLHKNRDIIDYYGDINNNNNNSSGLNVTVPEKDVNLLFSKEDDDGDKITENRIDEDLLNI